MTAGAPSAPGTSGTPVWASTPDRRTQWSRLRAPSVPGRRSRKRRCGPRAAASDPGRKVRDGGRREGDHRSDREHPAAAAPSRCTAIVRRRSWQPPRRVRPTWSAVVRDDVVGVGGRARHRRVRPEERLSDATVDLDVSVLERDAHRGRLERLLVDGDGRHGARLRVDLEGARDREVTRVGDQPPVPRRDRR